MLALVNERIKSDISRAADSGEMIYHCGDNIMWDPPVLIPNTEVKPHRADGTVRDTVWESRTLPHFIKDIAGLKVMQCPLTYVSGAACVFYMHAAPVGGTADSGTVSGYALARVRLCTRRSTVAAHSTHSAPSTRVLLNKDKKYNCPS